MPRGSTGAPTRALNGGSEHDVVLAPNREQLTHHPNKFSSPPLCVAIHNTVMSDIKTKPKPQLRCYKCSLRSFILVMVFLLLTASSDNATADKIRSFPTAEGAGAYSVGGRGGKVLFVTNLNDAGPGSLRFALNARYPRIIVFRVGGVIQLKTDLDIRSPYITIAGQTAPGDGICLKNRGLGVTNTHNVIVRYLRIRPGKQGNKEFDSMSVVNSENVIFDHCSFSWGNDEVCSLVVSSGTRLNSVTLQWCIISEGLDWYDHSMGLAVDSKDGAVTLHHNLFAHNGTRNPRLGAWLGHSIDADVRNNVFYNWRDWCGYGGASNEGTIKLNYVANYLKAGPSTNKKTARTAFLSGGNTTSIYSRGNKFHRHSDISDEDMINVQRYGGRLMAKPTTTVKVQTDTAKVAYERVLASAGAVLPIRDEVDSRIVKQVKNGTGKIIDSQSEIGGWPKYKHATSDSNIDSDMDGMPRKWENKYGLNPERADHNEDLDNDGYTNIEEFLNGTDPKKLSYPVSGVIFSE